MPKTFKVSKSSSARGSQEESLGLKDEDVLVASEQWIVPISFDA
jgi:hypothetical protein